MKKLLLILLAGLLVLSGVKAIDVTEDEFEEVIDITETFSFSAPIINNVGQYVILQVQETDNTLKNSGKPEMPMVTYSYDIPFGAKNIKISYITSEEHELDLEKKIKPTPQPVSPVYGESTPPPDLVEDTDVYSSEDRYPNSWYDSKISCGIIKPKERFTHISLYLYPVQYSPVNNKIYYIEEATIRITYDAPEQQGTVDDEYDLVIIAPERFSNLLQSFVEFKNNRNIRAFLKTTESIYNEYTGVDKPEQIKYFIKDAIETNNIDYVLLVGGLSKYFYAQDRDSPNHGTKYWNLPVRYTNIHKSGLHDDGALSDLYYADVYKEGGLFEDWDSNDDGIMAKWSNTPGNDVIDFYPDVYVGRLPCRNTNELRTVLRKIMKYEGSTPYSQSWYKTMVGISGLNHATYNGQPDGEYLTDLAMSYMEDIIDDEVRIYASNEESGGAIPVPNYITSAFTDGARFIYFSGHGHPLKWDTHPVGDTTVWMGGLHTRDMWKFFNLNKLPIVVVGGCHDAQFNITWWTTYKAAELGDGYWYWTHGDPGTLCFCWKMITIPWGGAVASIGGTGLTTSLSGQPNSGNAKLATDFFYNIGQEGVGTFGEAFWGATQKFIDENTIELWEAHVITIWNAFGDPSLQLT